MIRYSAPYDEQLFLDAFSSDDLVTWTKHPRILDAANITWARRAVWAPSVVERDGWVDRAELRRGVRHRLVTARPLRTRGSDPAAEPGSGHRCGPSFRGVPVAITHEGVLRDAVK